MSPLLPDFGIHLSSLALPPSPNLFTNKPRVLSALFSHGAREGAAGRDDSYVIITSLPSLDTVKGKIVAILRGGTPFVEMARRAQSAGAVGLIIVNTDDDLFSPGGGEEGADITIPVLLMRAKVCPVQDLSPLSRPARARHSQ